MCALPVWNDSIHCLPACAAAFFALHADSKAYVQCHTLPPSQPTPQCHCNHAILSMLPFPAHCHLALHCRQWGVSVFRAPLCGLFIGSRNQLCIDDIDGNIVPAAAVALVNMRRHALRLACLAAYLPALTTMPVRLWSRLMTVFCMA